MNTKNENWKWNEKLGSVWMKKHYIFISYFHFRLQNCHFVFNLFPAFKDLNRENRIVAIPVTRTNHWKQKTHWKQRGSCVIKNKTRKYFLKPNRPLYFYMRKLGFRMWADKPIRKEKYIHSILLVWHKPLKYALSNIV